MREIALIDNDFVQHLAEIKCEADREELVQSVFDAMNVTAKMHELVYKHEFMDINDARKFFDDGIFLIQSLKEIFGDDAAKETYYGILISELYKKKTGKEISTIGINDVLCDWVKKKSLGEYHSLAACLVGGYAIFLSDDRGSKSIVDIIDADYKKRVTVYSREEFVKQIETGLVKRDARRVFAHKK